MLDIHEQGPAGRREYAARQFGFEAPGKLKMPEQPATLHLLEGPGGKYDPESGQVTGAYYRYVVYIPWATAESTGLPLQPTVKGGPWIMDPGTHRAHIMISPPPED